MRTVILRCPRWMFGLLVVGALAPLVLIPFMPTFGWPPVIAWILAGVAVFILVYALTLLPTRLEITDEGICQKLLLSESRLRWEDMVEWRHCYGGEGYEKGELRAQTKNKWHLIEFWIKDKTGKRHYFKRWLVFGRRSKQLADMLREHGIEGG